VARGFGAVSNLRGGRGKTAPHYAVARGNFIVVLLLNAGADPDIADGGETPLRIVSVA
jgi:ankyrin repeat protein